ncbi:MAG TPA: laccase domain-containing protein [Candidatus Aminicenantes bacterium]|nr:laccase domain-containing protein [Candidatus Aminicenantes bacterium]
MEKSPPNPAQPSGLQLFTTERITYGHTVGTATRDNLMIELSHRLGPDIARRAFWLTQEHTPRLASSFPHPPGTVADGFFLEETGTVGIIRTADCTPLFFWDDAGETAGLVHVGWRGLAAGILTNWTRMLNQRQSSLSVMNVWLGPAIEGRCYAVGNELPKMFFEPSAGFWGFSHNSRARWTLDIRNGITSFLQATGIPAHRIRRSGVCTFCSREFPSYRRQGPGCGRILNFILRHPHPSSQSVRRGTGRTGLTD